MMTETEEKKFKEAAREFAAGYDETDRQAAMDGFLAGVEFYEKEEHGEDITNEEWDYLVAQETEHSSELDD
jgi:hypothetical protein